MSVVSILKKYYLGTRPAGRKREELVIRHAKTHELLRERVITVRQSIRLFKAIMESQQ